MNPFDTPKTPVANVGPKPQRTALTIVASLIALLCIVVGGVIFFQSQRLNEIHVGMPTRFQQAAEKLASSQRVAALLLLVAGAPAVLSAWLATKNRLRVSIASLILAIGIAIYVIVQYKPA